MFRMIIIFFLQMITPTRIEQKNKTGGENKVDRIKMSIKNCIDLNFALRVHVHF